MRVWLFFCIFGKPKVSSTLLEETNITHFCDIRVYPRIPPETPPAPREIREAWGKKERAARVFVLWDLA